MLYPAILIAVAAAAAPATPVAPREPPPVLSPPLARALEAGQAALAECTRNGWPHVAVTVLDSGGEMKAMMAADGTPPGHAIPRSAMKARTALEYRLPSGEVQQRAAKDPTLSKAIESRTDLLARAGGRPIMEKGKLIGAIGVSGAPGGDKDDQCAQAGLARLESPRQGEGQ